ncbi:hypothetical protein Tco_1194861 [Tanacetum coccineum]
MENANPIRTLEDYSKPSHEGYRNTIELLVGNNVVPLRSDTIWLVQNECSFHGLRSEDPNQHLKEFLKLVDSLDLDVANRERTRLLQISYDHVNPTIRRTIDQSAGGKLRDRNAEESWALLEDLALNDNESWNDPKDFAKPVKAISLTQDVPSISDRLLIELENQVQRLMEAHLAPKQPVQVNKISSSCEICSGPHDTQYCMEISSKLLLIMRPRDARLSKFEADFIQQHGEMTNKIDTVLKAITDQIMGALLSDTVKNPKMNVNSTSPVLSARSYPTEDPQGSSHPLNSINTRKTCSKETNHSQKDQVQTVMQIGTQQSKEPKRTLEDEFQDFHLNLPVLEVLAHAPIYNTILDKYVESLELRKNGSAFIQEWEMARDAEINPFKDVLVFRRMVEFLGALPINLKGNIWESEDLIKNPINWDKPPKMETGHGMPCNEAVKTGAMVLTGLTVLLIIADSRAFEVASSLLMRMSLAIDVASCSLCKVLTAIIFARFLAMKAMDYSIDGGIVRSNESTIVRRSIC